MWGKEGRRGGDKRGEEGSEGKKEGHERIWIGKKGGTGEGGKERQGEKKGECQEGVGLGEGRTGEEYKRGHEEEERMGELERERLRKE